MRHPDEWANSMLCCANGELIAAWFVRHANPKDMASSPRTRICPGVQAACISSTTALYPPASR